MAQESLAQVHTELAWVTTGDALGFQTPEVHKTASFSPFTQEPERSLVWRPTVHNFFSSKPVILSSPLTPHECRLIGRFTCFQKMGGESSCPDTCLSCSSIRYILQTLSVYLHVNMNTECSHKRLALFKCWRPASRSLPLHAPQEHWHSPLALHFALQRWTFSIWTSGGNHH